MMGKRRRTIDSDPIFQAGQDLENWSTYESDMKLTFDILMSHHGTTGYIKFIEKVQELDKKGDRIEVTFPRWINELRIRLYEIYGDPQGEIILEKALRWLIRYFNNTGQRFEYQ